MNTWSFQKTICIAIIFLTAIIVYMPIIGNDFVYDDYFVIVGNPGIQDNANPFYFFSHPRAFFNDETGANLNYRPIGAWIFSIEFSYFQYNPQYYHALSIVLHALNAIILFLIFCFFFNKTALAFLGSVIFLIHPIHTEVIANAKSRDEILSFLFIILTFIFALNYRESKNKSQLI